MLTKLAFQFFEKLVMDRGIKLTITTTLLEVPLPSTVQVSIHNNKTYENFFDDTKSSSLL